MSITGNKGEWSEIYVLLKLLGEGAVYAGDENMNKISDIIYPIIKIIREEGCRVDYILDSDKHIVFIDENGCRTLDIPMERFLSNAEYLLNKINSSRATFSVKETEAFMHEIKCRQLKAPSENKSDITIVIHDSVTGMNPELGFSIKSKLGSPSTLLNPGKTTNFLYRVKGAELDDDAICGINAINGQKGRMKTLKERGCRLEYAATDNKTFETNLMFVDTAMPEITACCLAIFFMDGINSVKEVTERVASENPLGLKIKNLSSFYEHKMKTFLVDVALGMTPAKLWTGRYDANGGYLVVRGDGDIVCYHFYLRNEIESYLYNNTHFDRASRSRYDYGNLFRGEDGLVYMRLNLQIRFD